MTKDTIVALAISPVWLVGGFGYFFGRKVIKGIPIFHSEDHKEKFGHGEVSSTPAPASGNEEENW